MIAQGSDIKNIFGNISPPIQGLPAQPEEGLAKIVSFGIRTFLLISALAMLFYLLWGGYDWITSGGDKEKLAKARSKITNAVIGMVITISLLAVYNLIVSDILKIFPSWGIRLPRLQ